MAAAALGSLVLGTIDTAAASPRGDAQRAAALSNADLAVVVTDHDTYVTGPASLPAGRVTVAIDNARDKNQAVSVGRLLPGYSFKELRHDVKVTFANLFAPNGNKKKGLKHLNHFIDNTVANGGIYVHANKVRTMTLLLKTPSSRYFVFNSTNIPKQPTPLTVTSPVGPQTLKADGTIKATTNRRFRGDKVLPAKGTIKFVNKSTESPHFLELQHVKEGTTRKDVRQSLNSNERPDFLLPGVIDTDILSTNQKMKFHVNLPKGEYVEMCFFPDPKTGMPHAFMGMIHIVHLR